jgi:leucyl/phenylalanyl-tRNA--protein transferase
MHFRPAPRLTNELWFPPVSQADSEGLVAIGGDLSPERLILAYKSGIFPWFSGKIPHWYSLDPRFVLRPSDLKISKSMRPIINQKKFELKINTSFHEVIMNCKTIRRDGQTGTWITNDIVKSYTQLHEMGIAHCAEAWQDGVLVGGLYGIKMGNVFFGESMFSKQSNASKFAFTQYVQQLQNEGIELIDCQMETEYLGSLGASFITRDFFMTELKRLIPEEL